MSSKPSPAGSGSTPHLKTPHQQQYSTPNTPALREQLQQLHLQQQQDADPDPETQRAFPAPQAFDILPSLHALLDRLLSASGKEDAGGDEAGQSSNDGAGGAAGGPTSTSSGSLDPKLLITEASAVKIRVQKARAAVDGLADVERSVEEQEREMEGLERKIEKLSGVIGEFGERSTRVMAVDANGTG